MDGLSARQPFSSHSHDTSRHPTTNIRPPTREMASSPTTSDDEVRKKNWSVEDVRSGLGIEAGVYSQIYTAIEAQLQSMNMLGAKVNTITNKANVVTICAHIVSLFPNIFHNIPPTRRDHCLAMIVRKCCYNTRRREKNLKDTSISKHAEHDIAQGKAVEQPPPIEPKHITVWTQTYEYPTTRLCIGARAFVTTRNTYVKPSICRAWDLASATTPKEHIRVDDLDFDRFLSVLREDINYDTQSDIIQYNCAGECPLHIWNERSWKTALEEMLTKGLSRFTFTVNYSYNSRYRYPNGQGLVLICMTVTTLNPTPQLVDSQDYVVNDPRSIPLYTNSSALYSSVPGPTSGLVRKSKRRRKDLS